MLGTLDSYIGAQPVVMQALAAPALGGIGAAHTPPELHVCPLPQSAAKHMLNMSDKYDQQPTAGAVMQYTENNNDDYSQVCIGGHMNWHTSKSHSLVPLQAMCEQQPQITLLPTSRSTWCVSWYCSAYIVLAGCFWPTHLCRAQCEVRPDAAYSVLVLQEASLHVKHVRCLRH